MASLAVIAEVYLKNEKHDKALSSVKEAESLFSSETTTDTQASHFLIKGKIHMALHQPDDALQAFNKSLEIGKEFSSIHQAFMDELKAQYGEFSNTEWRLISLMKMNLSSKDIANILRISPDGVKKARYRLRKKMDLASEVDIQDYLISY